LAKGIYRVLRVINQTAGLKTGQFSNSQKQNKMNSLQKKCLKKAIKVYTNLPVDHWYNQTYIDKITLGYHSVIIELNQYDIQILVKCEKLINGKPILELRFNRWVNGINEIFNCYETAYNFVPIYTSNYLTH
jgi:hypothetical protein